jgi:hypothetical protein
MALAALVRRVLGKVRGRAAVAMALGVCRSETRLRAVTWGFAAGSVPWLGPFRGVVVADLPVAQVLGLLVMLLRSDLSKEVELLVLRQENQVLRRQVRGRPQRDHLDRLWLAALSRLVHRRRLADVFPVTILRWHRHLVARKWIYTDQR